MKHELRRHGGGSGNKGVGSEELASLWGPSRGTLGAHFAAHLCATKWQEVSIHSRGPPLEDLWRAAGAIFVVIVCI